MCSSRNGPHGHVLGGEASNKRLPASETKRAALAVQIGHDGYDLLAAVYTAGAPGWLAELPAVDALRRIWVHQAQTAARAEQGSDQWKASYKARAGVEGTMHQAVTATGIRHARYLGIAKTRLEHNVAAAVVNLIRLDAYLTGRLDRGRTSHLARLDLTLAASTRPGPKSDGMTESQQGQCCPVRDPCGGVLVTGAAAAAVGAADARFVVVFEVGDQVTADPFAFLTHRAWVCPVKCEAGLVRSGAGSARYVAGHHPRASARPTT
jgi:hypothetical protein